MYIYIYIYIYTQRLPKIQDAFDLILTNWQHTANTATNCTKQQHTAAQTISFDLIHTRHPCHVILRKINTTNSNTLQHNTRHLRSSQRWHLRISMPLPWSTEWNSQQSDPKSFSTVNCSSELTFEKFYLEQFRHIFCEIASVVGVASISIN